MKLHILKDLRDGPWGGGNQFLKALRDCWRKSGQYVDNPLEADAILINSHHDLMRALRIKRLYPNKCFVHRIDGPIAIARNNGGDVDRLIFQSVDIISEAVVFQSAFSRARCLAAGLNAPCLERTILNAPDSAIFYKKKFEVPPIKTRIVATSWSSNKTKGFEIYQYLDQHLDFNRYAMTFIGNTPIHFKNINCRPPQTSADLGRSLRGHDIFLTASKDDPCSNSLIEGLHCGLPAVALRSGGHPSIVHDAGVLFDGVQDVLGAIDAVAGQLKSYYERIDLPDINQVSDLYLEVFKSARDFRKTRAVAAPTAAKMLRFSARWAWMSALGIV